VKVTVGAGDELEIALHGFVGTERRECVIFNCPEQQGLFVGAKFAEFIEELSAFAGGHVFGLNADKKGAFDFFRAFVFEEIGHQLWVG
jgi:hypothetical protein